MSWRVEFGLALLEASRARVSRSDGVGAGKMPAARPQDAGASHAGALNADARPAAASLLFKGCVTEGLFKQVNEATGRVLEVNGRSTTSPDAQVCCGALHAHAGQLDTARKLARQNIRAMLSDRFDAIITNAAGCGAMMKEYAHLLADDAEFAERAARVSARVRDVSELLVAAGPVAGATPVDATVTYDAPCHLLHAQRIADPPLAMLRAVPGLRLVPLAGAEHCCGAAGIYNLVEPDTSNAVLAPKLENIRATGAEMVATGNPGCLMQIGAGLRRASIESRAVHPVELLDASYQNATR
jgi:glycolate oxidase iron-sulfur subunit